MKGFLKAGITCFLFAGHFVYSQSLYSFQGLGTLNHQGMPNNVGSGELGIGAPDIWHVNTQNPANLAYNGFSTFQLGIQGESRTFAGDSISGSDFDGGLRFMAYAFPIIRGKWSSSFGILPFSSVSYNTFNEGTVEGDSSVFRFVDDRGEGGLTHFYWANGFVVKKKLFVGVRFNYTFGAIDRSSEISIGGTDVVSSSINYINRTSYSDLNFLLGASYRLPLSETNVLNFGMTFSNQSTMNGTIRQELTRITGTGATIESLEISSLSSQFKLPQTLGLGVSYQKLNVFLLGLDFETQGWKSSSTTTNVFQNQTKLVLGGRWTPDFDDVNSYLQRATYRFGFNYTQTPYIVNNESINDFGINFGASLPVSGFSSIDLAVKFGQLGTTSNGLIKESYYRIVIGATINDNKWFIKRKYD